VLPLWWLNEAQKRDFLNGVTSSATRLNGVGKADTIRDLLQTLKQIGDSTL
jgi:hypothetical protein